MASITKIEWTEATWNPVTGCSKISRGCKNCYAERLAYRLQAMGQTRYRNGFEVTLQPDLLNQPDKWRSPRTIFVNSMSDLFHDEVPLCYHRIDDLRLVPARVRFLSCEPLIGPIKNMPLHGIDWVIVGGESGPGARPMNEEWVLDIQRQCAEDQVSFFFKQWGGVRKKKNGRTLNGQLYNELPLVADAF